MPILLPPPAPPGDSLLRVRDRLVAWTLRHRLTEHPAITAMADLYDRRIAADEPSDAAWRAARDALPLDRALVALLGDRLPPVPSLDRVILGALEAPGARLDMGTWHSCATTHCRAGWAITLHPMGADLEAVFGPRMAGAAIYLRSTGAVPDFYASTGDALASIRAGAEIGGAR